MLHQFSRNELAVGKQGVELLKDTTVAILGVGELDPSRQKHAPEVVLVVLF